MSTEVKDWVGKDGRKRKRISFTDRVDPNGPNLAPEPMLEAVIGNDWSSHWAIESVARAKDDPGTQEITVVATD